MKSHRLAKEFIKVMDSENYEPAKHFLAQDCSYKVGEAIYSGPEAIIESYKAHHDFAKSTFESIVYKSELVQKSEYEFEVIYIDIITHRNKKHTYKCKQYFSFNRECRITQITHEDIPGENDGIKAFYKEIGL